MKSVNQAWADMLGRDVISGTDTKVTVGATDVSAYLIKGSMSNISENLEHYLNEFLVEDVTMQVSNHDEAFFESGGSPSGLFDDLSATIECRIDIRFKDVTDNYGDMVNGYLLVFLGTIDRDSIQRIRENVVQFTAYGYGKDAEGLIYANMGHTPYYRQAVTDVLTNICSDLSKAKDYDVSTIATEGNELAYTYLQEKWGLYGDVRWTTLDPTIHSGYYHLGVTVNDDDGRFWIVKINHSTGATDFVEGLAGPGSNYRWMRAWFYDGKFWTLWADASGIAGRIYWRSSTTSSSDYISISASGWEADYRCFYRDNDKLWWVEDGTGGNANKVRARVVDLDTSTITTYSATSSGTWHTYGVPIWDELNLILRIPLEDTVPAPTQHAWAYFYPTTDSWNTATAWTYGSAYDGGRLPLSDTLFYAFSGESPAITRSYNYSTNTWYDLPEYVYRLKEDNATFPPTIVWGWSGEGGDEEGKIRSLAPTSTTLGVDHGQDSSVTHWDSPDWRASGYIYGAGSQIIGSATVLVPYVLMQTIIPVVNIYNIGNESLRDLLTEMAKLFQCTVRISKSIIHFWSRDKFDGTASLTKAYYAQATEGRWRNWCDGFRLIQGETYYQNGSFAYGDRIMEINSNYFQPNHGNDLAYHHDTFFGSRRKWYEVDGVFLIHYELLDKITLSWLDGTVDTLIYEKEYNPKTHIMRLKLLEVV